MSGPRWTLYDVLAAPALVALMALTILGVRAQAPLAPAHCGCKDAACCREYGERDGCCGGRGKCDCSQSPSVDR